MALKIRLRRMGRKNAPTYRLVVAESTMPRDGRFVAILGHYNPRTEPVTLVVDRAAALKWIDKGATPTDTAQSLLKKAGVFGPEPTLAEGAVAAVKSTAKKAAAGVKGVVGAVAGKVGDAVEAVTERVEDVVDAVRGNDDAESEEK